MLFARFSGQAAAPVPDWGSRLFDPSQPGSFSHFYDTMSFGALRVRGEVGPRVYQSSYQVAAYLADDSTQAGQFGRFSLEILQGESHFQDLQPGRSSFGPPADGYPALRLRDGFVGVHQAALTVEIYAGETLAGQGDVEVDGLSPRQQVGQVVVVDSLGNGDGAVQGGEFIRLQVELAQVEESAPLRYFTFAMRALDDRVRALGSAQVVFADTATKMGSSGEFLVPVGVAPGSPLRSDSATYRYGG